MDLIKLNIMKEAAACLKILAHPIRLRMVEMMLSGNFTVGELAEACGIPSHMASEHLGKMRDRGLLISVRASRCIYYSVANPKLKKIVDFIKTNFGSSRETV